MGLVIFWVTRLVNLGLIPIFADEAIYIRWAQLVNQGKIFIPLSDGKTPLFMWLLAPLLRLGFDPLLTGRILSVAAGLATVIGIYFLTKKLFSRQAALVAAGLALLQPFLLFYDRMSLTDSLLTALIVWAAYFGTGLGLGIFGAAALLVKPSALIYLLIIPLFALKNLKKIIIAGLIAGIGYNLLRFSDSFYMIKQRSLDYLRPPSWEGALGVGQAFSRWLVGFCGWPLIIAFVVSLIIAVKYKEIKIFWLSLLVGVPFAAQAAAGKIFYPRYLLPLMPFILITVSWGMRRLGKLGLLLAAVIGLSWLKFDYLLLTDPLQAPLPRAEKEQYFYEWSAGYGLREIKDYLLKLPSDRPVLVATEGSFGTLPNGLEIYFNNSQKTQILGVGFPKTTVSPAMEQALQAGKPVYLVANYNRYNFADSQRLALISEYPRPGGEKLMFYEVH